MQLRDKLFKAAPILDQVINRYILHWSPTRPALSDNRLPNRTEHIGRRPAAIQLEGASPNRHIGAQLRRSIAFCLVPIGDDTLKIWTVDKAVGSMRNKGPQLITSISPSLFGELT
jgi:hypothetical protein